MPPPEPTSQKGTGAKLFFSYAREDELLLEELLKHLKPLEQEGLIQLWIDRYIRAGSEWEEELMQRLNEADIIVLLVSADFLSSAFIQQRELPLALKRSAAGATQVIPLIVRACDWQHTGFARFQVLPVDGIPVESWEQEDEVLTQIALELRRVVTRKKIPSPKPPLRPVPPPSRLRLLIDLALLGLCLFLVVSFVRPYRGTPLLRPDGLKIADSPEQETGNQYLTAVWPSPISAQWPIAPRDGFSQRIIQGDKLGLLKDLQTSNPYNIYADFVLELDLYLPRPGKIAWVVRAVDFANYYLFELLPPTSSQNLGRLQLSVWKNGQSFRVLKIVSVYANFMQPDEQPMAIKTLVRGNQFFVCLRTYKTFPQYIALAPIYDLENTFTVGGIGFFPTPGDEVWLRYLRINPNLNLTENPCEGE